MNSVLFVFLSLSLSGSILALILLALKPFIKNRLSQTWQYYIWLVVILRFLLPLTPEVSIVGEAVRYMQNTVNSEMTEAADPQGGAGAGDYIIPQAPNDTSPEVSQVDRGGRTVGVSSIQWLSVLDYAWMLWLGVALVLFVHKVASYRSFARFVRAGAQKVKDDQALDTYHKTIIELEIRKKIPLYLNEQVSSPMLVGVLRPMIIIPLLEASDGEMQNIFRHELTHFQRRDFAYKWLVQITVCLHWFNPLVHIMSKQINQNCELSCDEAVIKRLDEESRMIYGDALITSLQAQGSYNDFVVSITMSENANLVKERLDAIMKYSKREKWVFVLAVILAALLFTGGYALGAYTATPQSDNSINLEYGLTVYDGSKDISREVLSLWRAANKIYNVDDKEMFEIGEAVMLFEDSPEYYEIFGYDLEVDAVFTAQGRMQLEQTVIGGPHLLIQKRDGKVYKMGPWRTGYSYADALDGMRIVQISNDTVTLEVKYRKPVGLDEPPVFDYVKFALKKIDDTWLVDDYVYPEAKGTVSSTSAILNELKQSVVYDKEVGQLRFTIPMENLSEGKYSILVSGRIKMGDTRMSWHAFEEESADSTWEAGKNYTTEISAEEIDYILIHAAVVDHDGSILDEGWELTIQNDGNVTE